MLLTNLMVRTDDSAFKQAPSAFDAVRVNISAHPLFSLVIDALMLRVPILDSVVGRKFVSDNPLRGVVRVLFYERMENFLGCLLARLNPKANLSAPLKRPENHRLVVHVPEANVSSFPSKAGFVNLNG